jgi:hypothetical protein
MDKESKHARMYSRRPLTHRLQSNTKANGVWEWFVRLVSELFYIRNSRCRAVYLIFTYLFSIFSAGMISPPALGFTPCAIVGILFSYHFFYQPVVLWLQYASKKEWMVCYQNNHIERAVLLSASVMTRYFLILRFQGIASGRKTKVILFSDSFSPDAYRALRRSVRMGS